MKNNKPKIGLALAGGGIAGGIYEIGALRAIEEAIDGLDFQETVTFVGVSAGSFIASCMANGITTAVLCRSILEAEHGDPAFKPDLFFTPAYGRILKKGLSIPSLTANAIYDYLAKPKDVTLLKSVLRLTRAIPGGLFSNDPLRHYLEKMFSIEGRTDRFDELKRKLYIVSADLDSGEAVVFGQEGYDHVPISKAVQASSALPGIYPPIEIDGRYYVDGVLLKTMHASVALKDEVDIVICINPIVPVNTLNSVELGYMKRGYLVDRGLVAILSQTLRTLVHSRMVMGFNRYEKRFDGQDVILFEPERDDYRMFFTNIFSFSARKYICEHAYSQTLKYFRDHQTELEAKLVKNGLKINKRIIHDESRNLWESVGMIKSRPRHPWSQNLCSTLEKLEDTVHEMV